MVAAWIPVTLLAALAQTVRFVLQKRLSMGTLSPGGATFARFLYSAPLLAMIAAGYGAARDHAVPDLSAAFWGYALLGAVAQIAATMCTVALFAHRNFAVGVTFKKTEVLQTVLFGIVLLGEGVSGPALLAILVGLTGVLILSDGAGEGTWRARVLTRATGLGLASGVLFGLSGVAYRGAILTPDGGDAFFRPVLTLAIVAAMQTLLMVAWLHWRERGQIAATLSAWRVAGLVGLTSMAGSMGWFIAFGLQTAAYVKALGQVELVFSFLASTFVFGERATRREVLAIALICASVVGIVLAG
ncbi:MAG: EamA family transporter [Shimia sp.]